MLKRIFLMGAAALMLLSCAADKDTLRSGDLVFVGLPLDYSLDQDSMDAAISASTGDGELNIIHVAILEVEADSVFVIDATLRHGVDRHPLGVFLEDFTLKDGSLPVFMVKRVTRKAPGVIENAKAFCGEPYDTVFLAHNGAMYCSELVRESFRTRRGEYIFEDYPMNWKDAEGNIPVYWTQLFGLMGMDVPQGKPGTNPQRMSQSPFLEDVNVNLADYTRR